LEILFQNITYLDRIDIDKLNIKIFFDSSVPFVMNCD